MHSIPESYREIAYYAFQWVIYARQPLTTEVLLLAVCQDEKGNTLLPLDGLDKDLLLEYCHNLLVIDPVQKVWIPSHLSVIEYFENYIWSQKQANSFVLTVCLLVLQETVLYNRENDWLELELASGAVDSDSNINLRSLVDGSHSDEERRPRDPLRGQGFYHLSLYARNHWALHAQESAEGYSKRSISSLLEGFLGMPSESSAAYRCWHKMASEPKGCPCISVLGDKKPSSLKPTSNASFAICYLGFAFLLPNWHNYDWVKEDPQTDDGESLLELASISSQVGLCRDLIKNGAEVNARTESYYGSALVAASCLGNLPVVEFLVNEARAEVDLQLDFVDYKTALVASIFSSDVNIIKYLVKNGADVNLQLRNGSYRSALTTAACWGDIEAVKVFIECGAGLDIQL